MTTNARRGKVRVIGSVSSTTDDPSVQTADQFCDLSNGLRLCYRLAGQRERPAVVLLAGLASDLTIWPEPMVDLLVQNGFFVIRLDNRDIGRSSRVPTPPPGKFRLLISRPMPDGYDLGDMAGDVAGLLDHLDIKRAHVVGMSMGGMIGQVLAARHSDRVMSLTSIFSTTGAKGVGQPAWSTRLRILSAQAPTTTSGAVAQHLAMMRHIGGDIMTLDDTAAAAYAKGAWERGGSVPNAAGIARQINAINASGDRTRELSRITAPTLVVHGDTDRMVHPSGGAATESAISFSRLLSVAGMGHDLPPAAVARVGTVIVGHMRSVDTTGSAEE
ncbi:alpha/beta fold hydrolase (plasmid) [Rhodococcoides fascians A21d2]|uniref:alpha/beta fold hydrolase n=1 Tax=Rhodococcoides fascians TaxID=1828 RepID=UPI0009B847A5|nr:alpha/beta fold hydrolase [Rhodococcus fascians]QII03651.1 alpha/beta fold hydrolase [Rhodococcus fascians A21d2]